MAIDADKLTKDLRECDGIARKAIEDVPDRGTCNLDSVFLMLPRMREKKALEAIESAGLFCSGKRQWIGSGYMISNSGGQANKREHYVTVMYQELLRRGYEVLTFRMMD